VLGSSRSARRRLYSATRRRARRSGPSSPGKALRKRSHSRWALRSLCFQRRRIRPGWGSRCPSGWPPIASAPAVVRASARPLHCRHRAVASGAEVEERDLSERLAAAAHSRQGRPRTRHDPSPRSVQIRSRIRSRFVRCPARSSASRSPCSAWATCIRRRRSAAGVASQQWSPNPLCRLSHDWSGWPQRRRYSNSRTKGVHRLPEQLSDWDDTVAWQFVFEGDPGLA
jgi:hypothetical protein